VLSQKLRIGGNGSAGGTDFVLEILTTSVDLTATLPLNGTVNCTVDWGDGNTNSYTTTGNKGHTYASPNTTYTITISGTVTHFGALAALARTEYRRCLSFGDIGLTSLQGAFRNCVNFIETPANLPPTVTNLSYMFLGATSFNGGVGGWDTSNVTNMSAMFSDASSFSNDISAWDTSSVTDMSLMFYNADNFNVNIGAWDTSNVIDMSGMFYDATNFNQNIGGWNTANVVNMSEMFRAASNFNQNINAWNVSSVTNLEGMFRAATAFNQALSSWDTAAVVNMRYVFSEARAFNQNINAWDTSAVTDMYAMFYIAPAFNQPLSSWDTALVTNMSYMFGSTLAAIDANIFNQNIGSWATSNVTNMEGMFRNAIDFNQNISGWNTSAVTNMSSMFYKAYDFDQPIGSWNTANVLTTEQMFREATSFNQTIDAWNLSNATDTQSMFYTASAFNQPLNSWDVSNVTTMRYMFFEATAFNQPLNNWDTSKVSSSIGMEGMFRNASSFNQNLNDWCVGNIPEYPLFFDSGSALSSGNRPVWGTCPIYTTSGSITYIGAASGTTSATLPTHQADDLIIAFAFRDGSTSAPTQPSGWTTISSPTGANSCNARIAYRVATSGSTTTGTWTNATTVVFLVYRGDYDLTGITAYNSTSTGATNTITYNTNNYWQDLSWLIAFAGHRGIDTDIESPPGTLTLRNNTVDTVDETAAFDSDGIYSGAWNSTNVTVTGTASGWRTFTLRVRNQISLVP